MIAEGLNVTVTERYGARVAASSVDVLVTADPGANDDPVQVALVSDHASGFVRFGFVDPRVGKLVREFASTPMAVMVASK